MTVIVDYGMGNLRSVEKAVRAVGGVPVVSRDPQAVRCAERLILPGVGAFGDAAAQLARLGLDTAVREAACCGTPLLGICLGMQLLLEESEEYGRHRGLGLIQGRAVSFAGPDLDGLRVPHTGWNSIEATAGFFLDGLSDPYMYFVHSFHATGVPPENTAAVCTYGYAFVCALQRGSIWGTQFHPEKSGCAGLTVLKRFLAAPTAGNVDNLPGGVDSDGDLSGGGHHGRPLCPSAAGSAAGND